MSLSKNSKMLQFINYRMRITLDDRRMFVGRFLAFDKHMNVVLADCEEFRRAKKSEKEERRALGLVLLRGECVVSVAVESAPAAKKGKRSATAAGLAAPPERVPAGRGGVTVAPGLAGPAPGLGVPSIAAMQPQLSADPRMYAGAYGRGVVAPPAPGVAAPAPGVAAPSPGVPPTVPVVTPPLSVVGPQYGRGVPPPQPPYGGRGAGSRRPPADDTRRMR